MSSTRAIDAVGSGWRERCFDGRTAEARNGGESMARAIMIDLGFVPPDLQVEICDLDESDQVVAVDFHWMLPDGGVVVGELDGRANTCKVLRMMRRPRSSS